MQYLVSRDSAAVITQTCDDVIVAKIERVSSHFSTNGNPPILELSVERILRGTLKIGQLTAIWSPGPHDIDWVGQGSGEALEKWGRQALLSPPVDKTMILVMGSAPDINKRFLISPYGRFDFDSENLKWAIKAIGKSICVRGKQRKIKEKQAKKEASSKNCLISEVRLESQSFGGDSYQLIFNRDGTSRYKIFGTARHGTKDRIFVGAVNQKDFKYLTDLSKDIFKMEDGYKDPSLADGTTVTTSVICKNGKIKSVYNSNHAGPDELREIEKAIHAVKEKIVWK